MKDTTLFQLGSDLHENTDIGMYYCGKRIKTINHRYLDINIKLNQRNVLKLLV